MDGLTSEYGFGNPPEREAPGGSLPCQDSDNSNEAEKELSASQKKTAFALKENVRLLAEKHGIQHLGFLTLTFRDNVQDIKEAQKRFNSLSTGVIRDRYQESIAIVERQKSGRVHFHLLIVLDHDIRNGFDFDAVAKGDYRSANSALRAEWSFWRHTAPRYGFGRCELKPIRSCPTAISAYLGKYISKHIGARTDADKGHRLVRYSKGTAKVSCRFAFNSIGAYLYRNKLKLLATGLGCRTMDQMSEWFGPKWAFHLKTAIEYVRLPVYPTGRHYNQDHPGAEPVPDNAVNVRNDHDNFSRLESSVKVIVGAAQRLWRKSADFDWLRAFGRCSVAQAHSG